MAAKQLPEASKNRDCSERRVLFKNKLKTSNEKFRLRKRK